LKRVNDSGDSKETDFEDQKRSEITKTLAVEIYE